MPAIAIPYGRTALDVTVPEANFAGCFTASLPEAAPDPDAVVRAALDAPIASPPLEVLAKGKKTAVVIASDHTRPVPSRVLMPRLLERLRRGAPDIDVTILIATGFHRDTTRAELIEKFGPELVEREKIVVHDAGNAAELTECGVLPSGGKLILNRRILETDLLVSEGFIEPHFFAGFSGGRKSVLPGVASRATVLANHCAAFIADPAARAGRLDDNPIHRDMVFAAKTAKLSFILNVVLDGEKRIVRAFAGDADQAHRAGCDWLTERCGISAPKADIVVTGNGGHPLDQNVYQTVKGMCTAAEVCRDGGVIVMVSRCGDGHGGEDFYRSMKGRGTPADLLARIGARPASATEPDQWQTQILARILDRHTVIMVTSDYDHQALRDMGMEAADTPDAALAMAFDRLGRQSRVAVIPDGVSVIVKGSA